MRKRIAGFGSSAVRLDRVIVIEAVLVSCALCILDAFGVDCLGLGNDKPHKGRKPSC